MAHCPRHYPRFCDLSELISALPPLTRPSHIRGPVVAAVAPTAGQCCHLRVPPPDHSGRAADARGGVRRHCAGHGPAPAARDAGGSGAGAGGEGLVTLLVGDSSCMGKMDIHCNDCSNVSTLVFNCYSDCDSSGVPRKNNHVA